MMMFIANDQRSSGPANSLQGIEQPLNRGPSRTKIELECLNILIATSHFGHETTSYTPEIISPLADDLSTRCNNNYPINRILLNEFLSDCASRNSLARTRCSVDQKATILAIDNKP